MTQLVCVLRQDAPLLWPLVSDRIRSAVRRADLITFAGVERNVLEGCALLWIAIDADKIHAAAVTQIQDTETRKICIIVACGGEDRSHWLHLIEGIEQSSKDAGCSATCIIGRKGWARALKDYRTTQFVLEKELG